MQFIDSHCHLDFSEFDLSRKEILLQARIAGVSDIVVPSVIADRWQDLLSLVKSDHNLHAALGLHPCFMEKHTPADLEILETLLATEQVCAVGEIGLDLFIPEANLDQQLLYLNEQLALAKKFNLPVLLHVRKAHDQMLKQLRLIQLERGGIVHAFSGSEQQARQYLDLGFKLGIGGTVTYERAKKIRRLVQELPLESFVLETDAPDMPLAGHQGEVNLPANVAKVAEVIAELRQIAVEEVAAITTQQSKNLLRLI
ncbi:TatD family hydrolase [Neptuniibacter sp. QD34_54]|uniref:TatD family hydrolase n=1 Tax=unclassified Neptuniibacter TaxID=2630693 RepID=UPI0039F722F9